MRGRSVIIVGALLAAIGAAIIGGRWSASDEGGGVRRPATTMTPQEAARVAASVVRQWEAQRAQLPVLHCKLATPRQRYWCRSARHLTTAVVAAQILAPRHGPHKTRCVVKSEEGDLWDIDAGVGDRCLDLDQPVLP
jgi:hypothetical protein